MASVPALLLCLLSALLEPPPQQPPHPPKRIQWPPAAGAAQDYRARLAKERRLSPETLAAIQEAGLPRPPRAPRQRAETSFSILLEAAPAGLTGRYRSTFAHQGLRLQLVKTPGTEPVGPLGNDLAARVWGPAAKEPPLRLPQGCVERSFEASFPAGRPAGPSPGPLERHFGDHLLPVLWTAPLPCWVLELFRVLEIEDEDPVPGKSLIRDRTDLTPQGSRSTRAELWFKEAPEGCCLMDYALRVELPTPRAGPGAKGPPGLWLIEVRGSALFGLRERAFVRVDESVTGRLKEPTPARLAALLDEEFAGTIEIRGPAPAPEKRPGGKR